MEITFGAEIIQAYKRLSYTTWYALAEFIDNSTEAYLRDKAILEPVLKGEKAHLRVDITFDTAKGKVVVRDNSIGMNANELKNALNVGRIPRDKTGRSRYGLGMKTAACWIGNHWTIRTKKYGDTDEHFASIDVDEIGKGNCDVGYVKTPNVSKEKHYTIIEISKLNRTLAGKTKKKVNDFLRSMYRKDIQSYGLEVIWQNELLTWSDDVMINSKLHKTKDGKLMKKQIHFHIGEKEDRREVKGWVAVFEQGKRRDAGFSIIQNDRVIKGWPEAYRPESLFGDERNDLVNQRLVGELVMNEFAVSHTKDEIVFLNNEQEELEAMLYEVCKDYRDFALEYRKYQNDQRVPEAGAALNVFEKELKSSELADAVGTYVVPSLDMLRTTQRNIVDAVTKRTMASLKATVGEVEILLYLDSNMSPNDPYVVIESTTSKSRVIVILNLAHPHWTYLKTDDSVLNFIRHCVYDGVSEWKAHFILSRLDPDTIKRIKDGLLRVPMEMENHAQD